MTCLCSDNLPVTDAMMRDIHPVPFEEAVEQMDSPRPGFHHLTEAQMCAGAGLSS
jgi:hypothetical protein